MHSPSHGQPFGTSIWRAWRLCPPPPPPPPDVRHAQSCPRSLMPTLNHAYAHLCLRSLGLRSTTPTLNHAHAQPRPRPTMPTLNEAHAHLCQSTHARSTTPTLNRGPRSTTPTLNRPLAHAHHAYAQPCLRSTHLSLTKATHSRLLMALNFLYSLSAREVQGIDLGYRDHKNGV